MLKKIIAFFSYIFLLLIVFSFPTILIVQKEKSVKNSQYNYYVGTLNIPGTNFYTELVQAKDNNFFLFHNEIGEKSSSGAIFLDYRNQISDRKLLIYGHNSKTLEAPFHFLENYLEESYAKKNSHLFLKTKEKTLEYQLFSVMIVSHDFQHMNLNFDNIGYINHLHWLQEHSKFTFPVEVSIDSKIIVFQTCYYEPINSYLLVSWKQQ